MLEDIKVYAPDASGRNNDYLVAGKQLYKVIGAIDRIDEILSDERAKMSRYEDMLAQALEAVNKPFEHESELSEFKARQMMLSNELEDAAREFQESLRQSGAITTIAEWKAKNLDKLAINSNNSADSCLSVPPMQTTFVDEMEANNDTLGIDSENSEAYIQTLQ